MTFYPNERIGLFIDGANLFSTSKSLDFDIDYRKLLEEFRKRGRLTRANYYTALIENEDFTPLKPLVDWLDYNGFNVITKPAKEFTDESGRRRIKGDMDVELAVDIISAAAYLDHIILFTGDGDFRYAIEHCQRKGARVTVVSSLKARPPMVSDDLRRQADGFIDLADLRAMIGREGAGPSTMRNKAIGPEPDRDCPLCPRLVQFHRENRLAYPGFHNAPVPSFGDESARFLIVGLAPGLKGANQTGRPFTGDYAGDLLYATLAKFGFTHGQYGGHADDGLTLNETMITNAVRCVPPQNKPVGAEMNACRPFLTERIKALPELDAILCLGKIAHDNTLRAMGERVAAMKFAHQAAQDFEFGGRRVRLFDSYHCSRYNTNTNRLTETMFENVFGDIRSYLDTQP